MVLVAPDAGTREVATTALHDAGIQTSMHYPCVTDFSAFTNWARSDVPVSRTFASRAFTVPLHPNLDPAVIEEIAEILVAAAPASTEAVSSEPR
jgi:dTDP-4-amino-4,6-dideoxygalactose transaminase